MTGFRPWVDTLRPREGQQITRQVVLRRVGGGEPRPAAITDALSRAVDPRRAEQPAPGNRQTQPGRTAGAAYITVGSRPLAAMTINGRPTSVNPVQRYEVPAGPVRLRFVVSDATGSWTVDTTVTVAAGEHRIIGYLPLVRRP